VITFPSTRFTTPSSNCANGSVSESMAVGVSATRSPFCHPLASSTSKVGSAGPAPSTSFDHAFLGAPAARKRPLCMTHSPTSEGTTSMGVSTTVCLSMGGALGVPR
jgi:hypothetical protein